MPMNPSRYSPEELPFKVEEWSHDGSKILHVLALASNVLIGRAAFQEAVKQEPNRKITLRIGIRLIEEHSPD